MDVPTGVDAFDDLLAEVATFTEMDGTGLFPGLRSLLREVTVVEVHPVQGVSLEQTQGFDCLRCRERQAGGERSDQCCDGLGGRPELKTRDERAVRVNKVDGGAFKRSMHELKLRQMLCGKAKRLQRCGGKRASKQQPRAGIHRAQLHVVHDDETVQHGSECRDASTRGLKQKGMVKSKSGGVSLDASLCVEEEVVAALSGGKHLDGVGHHAVEPADSILACHLQPAEIFKRRVGCMGEDRLNTLGGTAGVVRDPWNGQRIEHLGTLDYSGRMKELDLSGWRWGVAAAWVLSAGLGAVAGAQGSDPAPSKPALMTKKQAKALFASVDEIMAFASKDSGLTAVPHVKRRLVSRDEVNKYLVKNFDEDESAKRLQRSEIVLKKFGLLSQDFQLRPFLLELLTEQIAGYYDNKTKTVNLLDWIEPDEQKPVLAHELTHALQDQKVNLEKWGDDPFHGVSHDVGEDNDRVAGDELETARQAVAEGQAMVVFTDWSIRDTGKTLAESPEVWEKLKDQVADINGSPVMARAPLLLQRSLEFPYLDGLNFEHTLLLQPNGKEAAFAGALDHPPSSSFEVMTPKAYLAHAAIPMLRLPDVHPLIDAEYDSYDVGVMGELDVEIMTSLFGGPEMAQQMAPAWNGGVYFAAQRKTATVAERLTTSSLAVMYYSQWRSAEAATAFQQIYQAELGRKYSRLVERKADETDSREKVFSTEEGDVLISRSGMNLFLSEGFPVALARKLREDTTAAQGSGPVRMAAAPRGELAFGLAGRLDRLGMMKIAAREFPR